MKRLLITAVLAFASTSIFAADVGVSISIGEPGFYGRLDIGGYPPPQVIYREPRTMYRSAMHRTPIYMNVPPGHAKNWPKHCRKYNACNERVYFVQNSWYSQEYVPRYQQQHNSRRDDHRDNHRDDRRDGRGNDRQDKPRNNGSGHGR